MLSAFAYYNTDYFTTAYFADLRSRLNPPSSGFVGEYFGAEYFRAGYFRWLSPAKDSNLGLDGENFQDSIGFESVCKLIEGAKLFGYVGISSIGMAAHSDKRLLPHILLIPGEWNEIRDGDPSEVLRYVRFKLIIRILEQDHYIAIRKLSALGSVVQNLINEAKLSDNCIASLTAIKCGTYNLCSPFPEHELTLSGEFAYLVLAPNSHAMPSSRLELW